ncbi:MAG: phosphopantothenoylcysteine decarboxylase [bacterium]|nr:phosphopantothenoylcysteine decarboxylase [bacterium]
MRILVTAGPTREFFDTVRFISNPSSGKMGYALAAAAAARGHETALVSGPVELEPPPGVESVSVVSAEEMFVVCCSLFADVDAAIMTAAVCDYRPARMLQHKLKKQHRVRHITLNPTRDICAHLGAIKEHRVIIGFAMEDHDHKAHAEAKLARKRCDAIVLNGPENVAADRATVEVLTDDGVWSPPMTGSKAQLADRLVGLTERLYRSRAGGG